MIHNGYGRVTEFKGSCNDTPLFITKVEVNVDKGAFPNGATPSGAPPTGAPPNGAFPSGAFPSGAFPSGAFPSGAFPTGASNDGDVDDITNDSDQDDTHEDTHFPVVREYNQLLGNKLGNPNRLGNPIRLLHDANSSVFIEVDIAAAGATNSLIVTDNVETADPTFMITVTFDRDQT